MDGEGNVLAGLLTTAHGFETAIATGRSVISSRRSRGSIATLFYEPSTRTRLSFELAALRLGKSVVSTEHAKDFSSAVKGETLEDTIRVISSYGVEAIVLRHTENGAASRAVAVSSAPVINAGDGDGEHPTQALIDLYTIWREMDRTDNLTVLIAGDLRFGRTVHSLVELLARFHGMHFVLVSPPELQLPPRLTKWLPKTKARFTEYVSLSVALKKHKPDILYWTRLQRERFPPATEFQNLAEQYRLTPKIVSSLPKSSRIMHPLPRLDEIDSKIDRDPRAAYFRQAAHGLPVRMAILDWVTG